MLYKHALYYLTTLLIIICVPARTCMYLCMDNTRVRACE